MEQRVGAGHGEQPTPGGACTDVGIGTHGEHTSLIDIDLAVAEVADPDGRQRGPARTRSGNGHATVGGGGGAGTVAGAHEDGGRGQLATAGDRQVAAAGVADVDVSGLLALGGDFGSAEAVDVGGGRVAGGLAEFPVAAEAPVVVDGAAELVPTIEAGKG